MTLTDKLQSSPPSRELDALVEVEKRKQDAYALGLGDDVRAHWQADKNGDVFDPHTRYPSPAYTTSIDAALTLMPEDRGCEISVRRNGPNTVVLLYPGTERWLDDDTESEAATPALALCIAIMKARAE